MLKPLGLLSGKALGAVSGGAGSLDELHGSFPQRTEDSEGVGWGWYIVMPMVCPEVLALEIAKRHLD